MIQPMFEAHLEKKKQISNDAFLYTFKLLDNKKIDFKPGQYIWLVMSELSSPDPQGERRAFSIVSSNKQKNIIQVLVKNSESGFKKTLFKLPLKKSVNFIGPFGSSYIVPENNKKKIVLIAGGVGLAPFLSIIRSLSKKPTFDIHCIHIYSPDKSFFYPPDIKKQHRKFKIDFKSHQGQFEQNLLPSKIDFKNSLFFICGPARFVDTIYKTLNSRGVAFENMRFEQHYPTPEENLTEKDLIGKDGKKNILLQALEDSKNHIIITDTNGQIIFANKKAEKSTGFKYSEMRGNTPRLWGGLRSAEFYKSLWVKKRRNAGFDGELNNRKKNGEIYTVLAHISPIYNNSKKIIGYIGTEEDITKRKNHEEFHKNQNSALKKTKKTLLKVFKDLQEEKNKLAESKAKNEVMLLSLGDGLIATDKNGYIVLVNPVFKKILGWSEKEVLGKKLVDIIPMFNENGKQIPESERLVTKALHQKSTTSTTATVTLQYKRKNGSIFPVAITVAPIILKGVIIGTIEVFRDITKDKQIDNIKSEFISIASHELKTPLGIMKWLLESMKDEDTFSRLPAQIKEYVEDIYQTNERLLKMAKNLLNISRIDHKKVKDTPIRTSFVTLLEKIVSQLQPKIHETGITISLDLPPKVLPKIMIDPIRLSEVFQNLLSNAIKYNKKKGKITIAVSQKENFIKLEIIDTGIGIPENDLPNIFIRFFRSENAIKSATEGSGLGLYLVQSYLKAWGGSINLESKENKGTKVKVLLPLKPKRL